jgi:hypothetical protein
MARHGPGLVATVLLLLPTQAEAQEAPRELSLLDVTPIRIGEVDGGSGVLFVGIVGATLLPSGELAVGDGGGHAVYFFDQAGRHTRTIGRDGAGPGEFRLMTWFGPCANGDLLAIDVVLGRATSLGPAGEVKQTISTPDWFRFNRVLSCGTAKEIIVLADHPRRLGAPGRVTRFPAALLRFTLGSEVADTLAVTTGSEFYFATSVQAYSPYPLGSTAHAAATGTLAYLAQSDESTVRVMDLRTRRTRTIPHGLSRGPVTAAAWRAAKAEIIDRQPMPRTRRTLAQVLDEAPTPRSHPALMDLRTDQAGRLWLRAPHEGTTAVWRVLGPTGEHLASVRIPANAEPLEIGQRHIVALERDVLDVQRILVYRFRDPLIP